MPTYAATGIVLHRTLLGEADKILTIYTREYGKLSAVARGVRKAGSRISGATELFVCSKFLLAKGKTLDIVSQCEIIESYQAIRQDLERLARAAYICELLDRMTMPHDDAASAAIHDQTADALYLLQGELKYLDSPLHSYELHLLAETGYAPVLDRCARCARDLHHPDVTAAFSASQGGLLCDDHRQSSTDASPLSPDALLTLIALRDAGSAAIPEIDPPQRVRYEIERAMRSYLAHRLDRRLKSADFLQDLRTTAAP